jgi:hypothetical protein
MRLLHTGNPVRQLTVVSIMGYAVAHEVGHCLLGPGHSYAGLMRGAWNRKDAGEMSRLSLHLTKQEARKAVGRLALAEPAPQR